ncbi:MAG: type VI secretion system-associated FHA domain protein TagH [Acetobacteraceae bacterium]
MAVTLRLAGGRSGPGETKLLTTGKLSIGRGPLNDWVLPDPERHLSKTHCVISIENGQTVLTDVSTNGVHINGARQATSRDSRVVLADGDEVRLGDYTMTVSAADVRPAHGSMPDPFADPATTGVPARPFGGVEPARGLRDIDPLDDPFGQPPDPAFRPHVAHRPIGPAALDPFDEAEERGRRPADPDDSLFPARQQASWSGPVQSDHADPLRQAFQQGPVIPPLAPGEIDFDALIGDLSPGGAVPPALQPPALQPATPVRTTPIPSDPFSDDDDPAAPLPAPSAAPPDPRPDGPFAEADRPAPPRAPLPVAGGGDGRAVLLAFLEGAGVAGSPVANADPEATMRAVGQVFRAMTEGLREVLMSRAAIKGDMRVEQTMIQARNNNALKFSVTPDEAVAALLSSDRPGYMPPLAATREAFHDLKSHELAVMAGVQTALLGLLKRFEPASLEGRLAQGLLGSVLPAARKARYWDSFCQVYGDIAREAEDDFQAVFGRAFAKAYSAQTQKIGES